MTQPDHSGRSVAVVGIGCRFPGGINDPADFWRFLERSGDAIKEIPADRIDIGHFFDPRPATPGRMMTRWGGFLDSIDTFDADFFGISPLEAERLDPQQRLLLELAWESLEDAGQDLGRLEQRRCGVFVGQWLSDFEARLFVDPEAVDFFMTTGSGRYASSGRISYALGLRGPSLTVDSACSSSLVAVHLAVQSIRSGESDLALAGGVNVILQPHVSVAYSQSRMMAPDGRCKFGDARGDGYVRSEGAGLVVLKPLDQARADGDRIYAVIRGSATNNDGRSSGSMGTPSRAGQEDLLRAAYKDSGVPPAEVGYVEAHGTGTRAGDPVELGALSAVLKPGRTSIDACLVGSVKTNFGHTEGAAGIAGLIKAALSLHHGAIPPSINLQEPNPAIAWNEVPLEVPRTLRPWLAPAGSRVAGVSAFGIAGTNAHVVLSDEPPEELFGAAAQAPPAGEHAAPFAQERKTVAGMSRPQVLPLSARSPSALTALASRYADLLESETGPELDRLCWSVMTRRTALPERAAFVATDRREMAAALRDFVADGKAGARGAAHGQDRPRMAFVLPGQGAQWVGMGRQLAAREPAFRSALLACDEAASPYVDWSILSQLNTEASSEDYLLDRIDVIQPVLVALAIAYAALWRSWGVVPDAVVGHSMGEVAAAHIAGVLDLGQAMRIICRRSALMRQASGKGAMALVELGRAEAEARIAGREALLSIAVSNSPRSSVVSGEPAAVAQLLSELEQEQVFCRHVKVDVASHSPQMEPLSAGLERELRGDESERGREVPLVPGSAHLPIYSTVLARAADGAEFDAGYWRRNMRQPVLFHDAIVAMLADGIGIFLELGPHPVLLPSVAQSAQASGAEVVTVASGNRDCEEQSAVLGALGALWANGFPVSWSRAMQPVAWTENMPTYPWQRERHWLRAADNRQPSPTGSARIEPLQPRELEWLHRPGWVVEDRDGVTADPGLRNTWLIVTDDETAVAPVMAAFHSHGRVAQRVSMPQVEHALTRNARAVAGIVLLASAGSAAAAYAPVRLLQAVLGGIRNAGGNALGAGAAGTADAGMGAASGGGSDPRLWLVTCGAQQVTQFPLPAIDVLQGAMWGAGRVIAEEQPERWGGMVDLDPAATAGSNASRLAAEVLDSHPGLQVAFRDQKRLVYRLSPANPAIEAQPGLRWRADSAYLVTGGLGGIGLLLASKLVDLGVRRLVLLGRTALPERAAWLDVDPDTQAGSRIAAVRALESKGASVHLVRADVSDEEDLARALRQYQREGWPEIRGVVHAVGLTENVLAHRMAPDAFERVFAPKAGSAVLLDRLLPDLEAFFMLSSISGVLGVPGMANYAAANVALDTLASDRRARGKHAMSVQWGAWRDTGLHAGQGAALKADELMRQGISEIPPETGVRIFAAIHASPEAVVTVMPVDFAIMKAARAGRSLSMFEGRLPEKDGDAGLAGGISAQLARAQTPADRKRLLVPQVKEIVGAVLKISPSRLDARRGMGTMGLTSLMAMELRNRLEALVARPLSATLAWNYPTIDALVAYLSEETPTGRSPAAVPATFPAETIVPAESLAMTEEMSDDDVAQILRRRPQVKGR